MIGDTNSSIDTQLEALTKSKDSYKEEITKKNSKSIINPYDLNGNVNADVKLSGPRLSDLKLEAKAFGKVWTSKLNIINSKDIRPFKATFIWDLGSANGSFSLLDFNFSLLSLVAPIPSAVNGYFGLNGKYSLING